MPSLKAICDFDDCEELVDAETVWDHMANNHGALSPNEWRLKRWPDGTAIVIDPDLSPPDG